MRLNQKHYKVRIQSPNKHHYEQPFEQIDFHRKRCKLYYISFVTFFDKIWSNKNKLTLIKKKIISQKLPRVDFLRFNKINS